MLLLTASWDIQDNVLLFFCFQHQGVPIKENTSAVIQGDSRHVVGANTKPHFSSNVMKQGYVLLEKCPSPS
jgi:hypothetical protein